MKIPDDNSKPGQGSLDPKKSLKRVTPPKSVEPSLEDLPDSITSSPKIPQHEVRRVVQFNNLRWVNFVRDAASKAEGCSLESERSALEEFDLFIGMCYPIQVDDIQHAANYVKRLLFSNGVDFKTEVQRRYDELSYRIGDPQDCAKKSIYAKILLMENLNVEPRDLNHGDLRKTVSTLSKLTKSQTRLFLNSIFFDPYISHKDLEEFITALEKITDYAAMGLDEIPAQKPDRKLTKAEIKKIKTKTKPYKVDYVSPEVTGRKTVRYVDPLLRRGVKDVIEFPVNNEVADIIDDLARDYTAHLENMAWNRRCTHIEDGYSSLETEEPWATSGGINLKERERNFSDPNDYGEEINFERKRQEILLAGTEAGLFDFTCEGLAELYDLAVDNDIKIRLLEQMIKESKRENKREYALDFICSEIDDTEHIQFDDGYLRFSLVNLTLHRLVNKNNSSEIADLFSAWLDHEDPMTRLATFKALGHEILFKDGKQNLISAINLEIADPNRGSRLLALLCRQLRLDKEYLSDYGDSFEMVFRELLIQMPKGVSIKQAFQNLPKVKIPYDENHEMSLNRTKKSVRDYLEYVGLNRLVFWATLDKDEMVRNGIQEILELYMDKQLVPDGAQQIENYIRSRDPNAEFLLDGADIISAYSDNNLA